MLYSKKYYFIPSLLFLCIITTELILTIVKNNGIFIYTLDDPYIHLSLAQRIIMGLYGLNEGEYSSPDSSILWPFLLAPFSYLSHFSYLPLIINIFCSLGILWVFAFLFQSTDQDSMIDKKKLFLLCLLIPALNLSGLVFMGMEHSLQVLLSVLLFLGLIQENKNHEFPLWLGVVIVMGPLVRYENLALSIPSVFFLYCRGHHKKALISLICLSLFLGSFSWFLIHIEQPFLPASVLSKSFYTNTIPFVLLLIMKLKYNLHSPQAFVFLIYTGICLWLIFFSAMEQTQKSLVTVLLIGICLHFLVGQFGYASRYEMYLHASFWLLILYGYYTHVPPNYYKQYVILCLLLILASIPYFKKLAFIPLASNNIYLQQYQMHRLVTQWIKGPVAANDIGLLSFNNTHDVLDLWGLGNYSVTKMRLLEKNSQWMDNLVQQHHVELVMIYKTWFFEVPAHWQLLGCLSSLEKRVAVADLTVHFYATNPQSYPYLKKQLEAFKKELPAKTEFNFDCNEVIDTD